MTLHGNKNPQNSEEKEREETENLYLNLNFQSKISNSIENSENLKKRVRNLADKMGIDEAKMELIRKKGTALYLNLKTEEEKLDALKKANDALIIMKNYVQGLQIGRNIDLADLSEEDRIKKMRNDIKYISPEKTKTPAQKSEARGLKGKCERLGIDFLGLMDRVRNE